MIYFRFTDQGLIDNNGNVLFSPEGLAAKIQQQLLEKRRAEDDKIKSRIETQTNAMYSLSPIPSGADVSPDQLVVTDVSVKFPKINKVYYFTNIDINGISFYSDNQHAYFAVGTLNFTDFELVSSLGSTNIYGIHDAVMNSYNAWKTKYPQAVSQ